MLISFARLSGRSLRCAAGFSLDSGSVAPAARRWFAVLFLVAVGGCLVPGRASAQATTETALDRQLHRVDVGVSAVALFNSTTNGTNYLKQAITDAPGNTVGALVTVRYTVKPYFGLEGNVSYARFTQNYSNISGVQANADEYSFGYVVHPPDVFGVHPFASIGAGTIAYKPTKGGGQGLLEQARAAYYYSAGAEGMLTTHIGARVFFRQTLSLAPDFETNYLTIKQRTIATQPGIGFFLHF